MSQARTVLITGATGGIGEALCAEFSNRGYFVIATDKTEPKNKLNCNVFIRFDLEEACQSPQALKNFVAEVRKHLKNGELHTLVNNAALQILAPTAQIATDDWSRTLNVNLTAPFLLIQSFLDELASADGSVVNVASIHAKATKPGFVAYATSKAALVGLTQALAVDLGSKVRVNAISPAATATSMLLAGFEGKDNLYKDLKDMHPIKRIAEPVEVAQAAVYLASSEASFITGATLDVDGGIRVRLHDPD